MILISKNLFTLYPLLQMRRTILHISLIFLSFGVQAQPARDTFKLFFDLGVPTLSDKMEKKIDLLIYNDKILYGSGVTIIGYADYLGDQKSNKALSMKRAKNVKDYLVKYGIREMDIMLCVGKGEISRDLPVTKRGYPTDRRVDIVMNNNPSEPPAKDTGKHRLLVTRKVDVKDINDIKRLKPGSLFKLKNVYFPADRHVMKPESHETLVRLYEVLRANPNIKISIEGHVCCIRDTYDALDIDTYEPYLSVNRAKAIYNYLADKGIDKSRLSYRGYGRSRPEVVYEQTEADAERNRRVEIRILDN